VRLFDTLSREIRELSPVDGEVFRFYCCGPTVYGPAHIGNFRTFVLQDVLRRVLEIGGMKTCHVRNITDLDDKTIRDAQAAGEGLREFTARWTQLFHEDCAKLNCLVPDIEPSAVEHIPQQITMVEELIAKGHAYASEDGSVYFKIESFAEYGALSGLDRRELELGKTQNARANADEYEKEGAADFVLWKGRKEEDGDNFWTSPWGEGRPGWHLECSAMIREYLGETFDLHGGGVDLTFPHHENEIAQSKCSCGGEFARHWFHATHLRVDGRKMSKSLGNLYTIAELVERGITPMEVRLELMSGYYRKPLNFTFESLQAKHEAMGKLARGEDELRQVVGAEAVPAYADLCGTTDFGVFAEAWEFLNNDLNTAGAMGKVFTGLKKAASEGDPAVNWRALHAVLAAFGLILPKVPSALEVEIPSEVRELAERRWAARSAKDWAASDVLRDELAALGWVAKDGRDGYSLEKSKG